MPILLVASILLARTVIRAPTTELPSGGEAPRATDLFRAKRMADEATGRLRARPPHCAGWAHGGSGWKTDSAAPVPDPEVEHKLPTRRRVR
jgi:hypothetical protein